MSQRVEQKVSVLRGADNVFMVQPVSRAYMNTFRAMATAIIYRFARINCGFGASDADLEDTDCIDEARTTRTAVRVRSTPGHVIQVIFAQWLAVYAGMQMVKGGGAIGTFAALRPRKDVEVVNDPRAVDGVLERVQEGSTVLAPCAVLAYLLDWYGGVQPAVHAYAPSSEQYQRDLLPLAKALQLSSLPKASFIGTAFRAGLEADFETAYTALVKLFREDDVVQIRVVKGAVPTDVNLQEHSLRAVATDSCVQAYDPEDRVDDVPSFIHTANLAQLLQPSSAVVVVDKGMSVVDALLNRTHEDAPLTYVAVNACIEAAWRRAPPDTRLSDLTAQVWGLFPYYSKDAVRKQAKIVMEEREEEEDDGSGSGQIESGGDGRKVSGRDGRKVSGGELGGRDGSSSSVVRRKTLAIRPGRWFTEGPSVVTLYVLRRAYNSKEARRAVAALLAFYSQYAVVVSSEDKHTYVTDNGVPLKELVLKGSAYEQRPVTKAVQLRDAVPKTSLPFWAAVLSRQNLLWLASVPNDRPRQLLERLWNRHHLFQTTGRRFDDAQAAELIRVVLSKKYTHAQKWEPDAMLEMVFALADSEAADMLAELESYMTETTVCTRGEEIYYGALKPGQVCQATHVFQDVVGTDDLMLVPLPLPQDIAPQRQSEWFTRGVCVTTTQLALLFGLASGDAKAALRVLVDACVVRSLQTNLRDIAQADKMEIYRRFTEEPLAADNVSHVTLTA